MVPMGALQPGLPFPPAIPKGYFKIIIDLKDCFFTIPLHPEDCKRFAFSLPSINFKEPAKRFHWKVLPQGIANSPTLCQKFVQQALQEPRKTFSSLYIVHYMDDILLAGPNGEQLLTCYGHLLRELPKFGLVVAPDKVQLKDPYTYLGFKLNGDHITTQKATIRVDNLKTLNDFQKLLGDINWIRPYLKLTTGDLRPLFDILNGDPNPNSFRTLTPEARKALTIVEHAISKQFVTFIDYSKELSFIVFKTQFTPTGVFWQKAPITWVHMHASPPKVIYPYYQAISDIIRLGSTQSKQLFGKDPDLIIVPYNRAQQDWLRQNFDDWSLALLGYTGKLDNHYPSDKLCQFLMYHPVCFPRCTKFSPIKEALTIFTDGSASGVAAYSYNGRTVAFHTNETSAQRVEMKAIVAVLLKFEEPINIYTDSAYLANSVPLIEIASQIKQSSTTAADFKQLQNLIWARKHPFFIGHIRAHSGLPGPLSAGNDSADKATKLVASVSLAKSEHAKHHLNAHTLRLMFKISREQARQIVKDCSSCDQYLPVPHYGVNPKGLIPNALWQIDVTHIPEFGKQKFVHVLVDTYSNFTFAAPLTGEATKNVIAFMLESIATLGKPQCIKTDNGPGYTS
uniref:Uncharacterized protein n=1 Tax=Suricata suricatta TaxID=37032 RepID=A0A673U1S2_SURSU